MWIWRLGLAATCAVLALQAALLSAENIAFADATFVVSDLEKHRSVDSADLVRILSPAALKLATDTCRGDILRPLLSLSLVELDRQDQTQDPEAWSATLLKTGTFITRVLTCLPSDGNAWLRNAMVSAAIAEEPKTLSARLQRSEWFTPSEADVLAGRVSMWRRVSRETLDLSGEAPGRDIATMLNHSNRETLLALLAPPGPRLLPIYTDALKDVSGERMKFIAALGLPVQAPSFGHAQ